MLGAAAFAAPEAPATSETVAAAALGASVEAGWAEAAGMAFSGDDSSFLGRVAMN